VKLIENGADIDMQASNGATALMMAAEKGRLDLIRVLLYADAKPNLKMDGGYTALFIAQTNGHSEAASILVGAGAR